ncbi:MAG: hypothetical protein ACI4CT_03610 [Lachnospiraceae bacterium]
MRQKLRSIFAILTIVVLAALVIATLVLAIMGSDKFMPMLFITIIAPIVLWAFMHFYEFFSKNDK